MKTSVDRIRQNTKHSLLCSGLDPDLSKLPEEIRSSGQSAEDQVLKFMRTVIDLTAPHVCAYKAQKAFFDILSGGHDLLAEVIEYAHRTNPEVPIILDCKIGDIDNTMGVYLDNIFGKLKADGVVINPYMGQEVIFPFVEYPDKAVVVLAKTSNPGGAVIQDLQLTDGSLLWQHVLKQVTTVWNLAGNMVPVVSSTANLDMASVRRLIPDDMPILLAGVGAQGGSYADLGLLLNSVRSGVFVNSSRAILYPATQNGESWQDAILRSCLTLKAELEDQR